MTAESDKRERDPRFRQQAKKLLADLKELIPQVEERARRVDEINARAEERRGLEERALREVSEHSVELQKQAAKLAEESDREYHAVVETCRAVGAFIEELSEALKFLSPQDPLRQEIEQREVYRGALRTHQVSLSQFAPELRRIQELLRGAPPAGLKRGRPSRIPDERKAQALAAKRGGASNKQVAQILYATHYPTPAQIRCVHAILKNYERGKAARPDSAESPGTAP